RTFSVVLAPNRRRTYAGSMGRLGAALGPDAGRLLPKHCNAAGSAGRVTPEVLAGLARAWARLDGNPAALFRQLALLPLHRDRLPAYPDHPGSDLRASF